MFNDLIRNLIILELIKKMCIIQNQRHLQNIMLNNWMMDSKE